jgi:hypothetical protein
MTECMSGYDRRAVIRVGGGRGFIVGAGDDRYVITAAHCLPPLNELPTPHLANDTANLTFRNIIGQVAARRLTIWGELCVFSLCDDIAVFSAPDGQELYDEYERYEKFTRSAMVIGSPPAFVDPFKFTTIDERAKFVEPPGTPAWVFSLECEWLPCTVHNRRWLRITNQGKNHIEGGMSGSPIIDKNGAAIGMISTGDGDANPVLMDCLPPWLLRKLDVA